MSTRKFPFGVYLDCGDGEGGRGRPNLPAENNLLRALQDAMDAGYEVLEAHDPDGSECDCVVCRDIRCGVLYPLESASSLIESMLKQLPDDDDDEADEPEQAEPAPLQGAMVKTAPPCQCRSARTWPDSNPANPPGAERLADSVWTALEAVEELQRAQADGWDDELLDEVPGIAWTLKNLIMLLDGRMSPYGDKLREMLDGLSDEHSERLRLIYEHEGRNRGPVCPDGQCWLCDRRQEELAHRGRAVDEPVRLPDDQADDCEPVLVTARTA